MKRLTLNRVCYGSDKTPLEEREYSLGIGYPVGTLSEIKTAYVGYGYDEILLMDKAGSELEQKITYKGESK